MIVDTSVIVAILHDEPETAALTAALAKAESKRMSAGSRIELSVVVTRTMQALTNAFVVDLLARLQIEIAPVSASQTELADAGFRKFGKGSGHPARLNFGDCFAYALAKESGEPLLFKGDDFSQTDIRAAIAG